MHHLEHAEELFKPVGKVIRLPESQLDAVTALSGSPTMLKAGSPGATCTWTSTARASMPSNATVETRWTIVVPALRAYYRRSMRLSKNIS